MNYVFSLYFPHFVRLGHYGKEEILKYLKSGSCLFFKFPLKIHEKKVVKSCSNNLKNNYMDIFRNLVTIS